MKKPLLNFTKSRIIKKFLFDCIFPKFCVGCGLEGSWLCGPCEQKIISVISQVCPKCGRLSRQGRYCGKCRKGYSLKGIFCGTYFEEGPVKELIHHFKYNSVTSLAEVFGQKMANTLNNDLPEGDLVVAFVPLHSKRYAQRGYNQSELLARSIANKLNLPVADLLLKRKKTKRQVELHGQDRRKNLSGMFAVKHPILKGQTIILVDDVTTTGATLNECAKVCKSAGAKAAWGLVIARG